MSLLSLELKYSLLARRAPSPLDCARVLQLVCALLCTFSLLLVSKVVSL